MVSAAVIDPDGVYDPCLLNDRLLLGLKGTMSEFELNLLRQRSAEAVRQKAHRGELQFCLPIGYIWVPTGKIEMDPDLRIQQALQLVFSKMTELGSVRKTLLWFRGEGICLPAKIVDQPGQVEWKLPLYNALHRILTNPIYAGAYAFGKTGVQIKVVGGRARKASGHRKPREEWMVLIREHHSGYISWEQFERNQALIAANCNMKSRMETKSGRGGRALLAGIYCDAADAAECCTSATAGGRNAFDTTAVVPSIRVTIGVLLSADSEWIKQLLKRSCKPSRAMQYKPRWKQLSKCNSSGSSNEGHSACNWSRPSTKQS